MHVRALLTVAVASLCLHCGDSEGTGGAGSTSTTSGSAATGAAIPDFNGCTNTAYVDRSGGSAMRTIEFGKTGLTYTPKCMIVAAGQTVTFDGAFTMHPLAPGDLGNATSGSPNNPIKEVGSGTSTTVTFSTPGTYPYHCTFHSQAGGGGMTGVVHVR